MSRILPSLVGCVCLLALLSSTACGGTASTDSDLGENVATPLVGETSEPLIAEALRNIGATNIVKAWTGEPPGDDIVPLDPSSGSNWIFVEVRTSGNELPTADSHWQAAGLAGEYRNLAVAARLAVPFGYSTIDVWPDGEKQAPIQIQIGAPVGTLDQGIEDTEVERSRITAEAEKLGLRVDAIEFRGRLNSPVVRASTDEDGAALVVRWQSVISGLVGPNLGTAALTEIDDLAGGPIKSAGYSPTTAGVVTWTRPDLRVLEAQERGGGGLHE